MAASYGGGTGSCSGCSIVVAGAGGAMYGYALETDGTTYCHVAAIGGSRAADSADVVGSVRGHRATGSRSRLRNRNTALSGDGDAGSQ